MAKKENAKMSRVSREELATILAALRYYQKAGLGDPANREDAIQEIATDSGELTSLDPDGIDELCERLNCAGAIVLT